MGKSRHIASESEFHLTPLEGQLGSSLLSKNIFPTENDALGKIDTLEVNHHFKDACSLLDVGKPLLQKKVVRKLTY